MHNEYVKNLFKDKPQNIKLDYKVIEFTKDEIVTRRGNEIEKIYICIKGKLQVKNEFENGFIYNFAQINSISYIGIIEILAGSNIYTSTLKTITNCILVELDIDDFKKWINNDPKLAMKVLEYISKIMHEQSLNHGDKLAYPAIYLLTNYLINEYENGDKEVLLIKNTREEIGATLGVSVRTVNRNLKILKEENLISTSKRAISINKQQFIDLSNKLDSII